MILHFLLALFFCLPLFACENINDERYIFFLHNRLLEINELNDLHPEHGRTEYLEIISEFEKSGFEVISDVENIPDINFCGNIQTIYERSDPFGVSAIERINTSTCEIKHFKEIELDTGLGHGFLFKPLKQWIEPTAKWASGDY